MWEIDETTIKLTRGDSFFCLIGMKKRDGTDYEPQEGDKVRFALKKTYDENEVPLIIKEIRTDDKLLHLLPEDTKDLAYGKYVYDVQLTTADGEVDTFIDKATFRITEEVD